ncbi:hypothetical protein FLAG1_05517 [Fusarium langsethiae]|uniref:Uncharacterized protein n=1 Tax=Fusarium langsethiae TaxID=179993 RepID=A0A0N0DET2_FUSLA|nr:hypothetical protein FLAG1_05517 [Fusarium langsethiae]
MSLISLTDRVNERECRSAEARNFEDLRLHIKRHSIQPSLVKYVLSHAMIRAVSVSIVYFLRPETTFFFSRRQLSLFRVKAAN